MPHLKTGRLRALGVTSSKRSDVLPEVPAISETLSGYEALAWFGLFGPAAMPADLVRQVNAEMVRALGDAKVREMVRSQGGDAGGGSPEQFQAFVNAEIVKWAKVIKRAGVEALAHWARSAPASPWRRSPPTSGRSSRSAS
jgi:tripartite-type tricarboxylate transporter receptor subunit TctC